jgi:hypothetical protein
MAATVTQPLFHIPVLAEVVAHRLLGQTQLMEQVERVVLVQYQQFLVHL